MTLRAILYEQYGQTGWIEINREEHRPNKMLNYEYTGDSKRVESRLIEFSTREGLVAVGENNENRISEQLQSLDKDDMFAHIIEELKSTRDVWDIDIYEV